MAARGKKLLKVHRQAAHKHTKINLKQDDTVQIMTGNESGKVGKVLRVMVAKQRVVVEGANKVFKHVKKTQQNPQGGRVKKEAPIHISNVMLADPKDGKPTRVRIKTLETGQRVRVAVRSGEQLDS